MEFQVHAEATYQVRKPSTVILNLHALQTPSQTVLEEHFQVEPRVRCEEFLSSTGENRLVRLETGRAKKLHIHYTARVKTKVETINRHQMESVSVAQLDRKIIPYLFPSRYCQSDRLGRLAWGKFGSIQGTYSRALAISDWIYRNIEYLRGSTNSETSAFDTITQRAGVCRDFAHLGIALCRALSIPARYFSGYAYQLQPPDFHACFEVYIGSQWFIFDATRLAPLNGLVRIATGRDAADASIATIFGSMNCEEIQVRCDALDKAFQPWPHRHVAHKGLSLDG
jgi:transglutaminase-like putative cysteine protease